MLFQFPVDNTVFDCSCCVCMLCRSFVFRLVVVYLKCMIIEILSAAGIPRSFRFSNAYEAPAPRNTRSPPSQPAGIKKICSCWMHCH